MTKLSLKQCRYILHAMSIAYFILHSLLYANMSTEIVNAIMSSKEEKQKRYYNWSLDEQTTIVQCVNYFTVLSAFFGGHLAQTFGSKTLLTVSTLSASFLTLLNPVAAYYDYYSLMAARIVTSMLLTLNMSAFYPLALKWTGPGRRSVFVSHMTAGLVGLALVAPLSRFAVRVLACWESVFYVTGCLGLVWTGLWFWLVFDSPLEHPKMGQSEILIVEKGFKSGTFETTITGVIPWGGIVRCVAVWAGGVACFGEVLGFCVIYNYLPVYYQKMYSLKVEEANVHVLSFQLVAGYLSTRLCCHLSEKLIKTGKISKTTTRKIFSTVGLIGSCLLLTTEVFFIHTTTISLIIFTLIYIFLAISASALLPNILDLVPIYSGSVFGIIATFTALAPQISHKLINFLTESSNNLNHSKYVLISVIVIHFVSAIVFLIFGSGNVQNTDEKPISNSNSKESICLTEISHK